jgi:hypothetical protein
MSVIMTEHATRWRRTFNEARGATKPGAWLVSGSRGRKEHLPAPKHGPASGSAIRSDRSQHMEDLDLEHPLKGPHATD